MSISHLEQLDETEFMSQSITPPGKMVVSSENTPFRGISVVVDGWADDEHLVFTIADDPGITSQTAPNTGQVLDINAQDDPQKDASVSHWKLKMGDRNHKGDKWELTFNVSHNRNDTGKWVFSKGDTDTTDVKRTG